jgi:hypothetical protein
MNVEQLDYLRENTCKKFQDDPITYWWIKQPLEVLNKAKEELTKELKQDLFGEAITDKMISELKFINYLIKQ